MRIELAVVVALALAGCITHEWTTVETTPDGKTTNVEHRSRTADWPRIAVFSAVGVIAVGEIGLVGCVEDHFGCDDNERKISGVAALSLPVVAIAGLIAFLRTGD